jgi:hypothetical protein
MSNVPDEPLVSATLQGKNTSASNLALRRVSLTR